MENKQLWDKILQININNNDDIWITVHGSSMFPILREGYKVHVKKVKKLFVGQIIVFSMNDIYVVHRIIKINDREKTVITIGDDVPAIDGIITFSNILGEVDCFTDKGNRIYYMYMFKWYTRFSVIMSYLEYFFVPDKKKYHKISKLSWLRRNKIIMKLTLDIYNIELGRGKYEK